MFGIYLLVLVLIVVAKIVVDALKDDKEFVG